MPEQYDVGGVGVFAGVSVLRSRSSAAVDDPGVVSASRPVEPGRSPVQVGETCGAYGGSVLTGRVDWRVSGVVMVSLAGELDLSTAERAAELIQPRLAAAGVRILVLDLSELSFIGSAGLGVLLDTQTHARAVNIAVQLITGAACVDRALEVTGLRSEFVCVSDLPSAVQ